ncbi:delta-delta-dienoyl-CoA isomerase [Mytilinidion resinicola]|uniref:Delta-delta-dienoyl-CoA isomerase n=1 Tax=Mytilinidion resinicola TaxID=574789 RepID=A0A6A6YE55_9PEZI|nr:delta-delta-dienoyl-CoA isomerase [Mytilinidion resinicola]KAF2806813.1 delta-delta-dienoyl-CoA isomerase [Mytilinidion resinicola]
MASYTKFEYFNFTFPRPFVAHIEVNRASKMNAWIEPMWHTLKKIFDQLSEDPQVRAVILSGAGEKAFTAGLDVHEASTQGITTRNLKSDPARRAVYIRRHLLEFQSCLTTVEKCEKPVIIIMHGITIGLGIDLASCCDIRICTEDVMFAVKEVDIGLAADVGTLTRLPKIVGNYGWVKEVCLTARYFGAQEAMQVGFVGRLKVAELLASKSPVAVQSTKELLNFSRDHTIEDGLRYTGIWNSVAVQATDVQEAMLSGLQKRIPKFEKL